MSTPVATVCALFAVTLFMIVSLVTVTGPARLPSADVAFAAATQPNA